MKHLEGKLWELRLTGRDGIARALLKWNIEFRPVLKSAGYLTRDSRAKERKKFGLYKARRAHQWRKR